MSANDQNNNSLFKTITCIGICILFLYACTIPSSSESPEITNNSSYQQELENSKGENSSAENDDPQMPIFSLTYQNADGNRIVSGKGGNISATFSIPLDGIPVWVLAEKTGNDSFWYIALSNGEIQSLVVDDEGFQYLEKNNLVLPPGMPPILVLKENNSNFVLPPNDASPYSHPIYLGEESIVYINNVNDLVFEENLQKNSFPVNALSDARILTDGSSRLVLLVDPTTEYTHGVLGDGIEAKSILIFDYQNQPYTFSKITVNESDVIEGISPLWVDINNDGKREIIVTQSNEKDGARLVVYDEKGNLLSQSEPIGTGNRWLHQIAVSQFIPGGEMEIAVVETPHINGTIKLYTYKNGQLSLAASLAGFSSHKIGSRNLDSALAADFNGDGILELILPNQKQTSLNGIQYEIDKLEQAWQLDLGSRIATNLAAIQYKEDQMMLGAGTDNNMLKIWITD